VNEAAHERQQTTGRLFGRLVDFAQRLPLVSEHRPLALIALALLQLCPMSRVGLGTRTSLVGDPHDLGEIDWRFLHDSIIGNDIRSDHVT
jgi:hypothetical protein